MALSVAAGGTDRMRGSSAGRFCEEAAVQLWTIGPAGLVEHPVDAVGALLAEPDGLVWLDIPSWDEEAERVLRDVFHFHPLAIRACAQRNQVPNVHVYADHVFLVLHAPQAGAAGHVHSIELDQFVGDRYLVTVHGPLSPAADPAAARAEVDVLEHRLTSGRLRPEHAYELSHALSSAVSERLRTFITERTADLWEVEYRFQAVVNGGPGSRLTNPEQFLDELFRLRHGFLVARTQAALSREVFARMVAIKAFGPGPGRKRLADSVDQFHHLRAMAETERENLQGTIEFYQARTTTQLTMAAERLAVISLITLPVTAVSSVLGMNLIVNTATQPFWLVVTLLAMAVMSALLLRWARRLGWW